jgi:serine/threonine protein kinase
VRVQTYFEAFGTCFLVMDYVEGPSLASVFRQEPGGLAPTRVRSLLTQLLSSIRVVHRAGLVHRDIKPANVILREGDRLVLIDFGATRQATPSEATTYTQIYSGGYGPPEQILGLRQGEFSDIYAIGAVCYRAIGGTVMDSLARQNSLAAGRADPQASAATIGAGRYPPTLLAAIDAALTVDAARRPQSADAMLGILRPDEPAGAPTSPVAGRSTALDVPRVRRPAWIAVAGLGAVALAGAAYFILSSPVTPPPRRRRLRRRPSRNRRSKKRSLPRRRWPCRRCPPSRRPCRQLRRPPRPHRSTRRRMWPDRCPAQCCVLRSRGMASARPVSRPPVRTSIAFSGTCTMWATSPMT